MSQEEVGNTTESLATTSGSTAIQVNTIPEAMAGFVQGAMPPEGVDVFLGKVETTFTNVVELYSNMFGQVFAGFGSLFEAINKAIPAEKVEACVQRKISVVKNKTQEHASVETTEETAV